MSHTHKPKVDCFFHEDTNTCCYLVSSPHSGDALLIDSVLDYDPVGHRTSTKHADQVISAIRSANLTLHYILETHVHADHLTGAQVFKSAFPKAKTGIGFNVAQVQQTFSSIFNVSSISNTGSEFDILLKDQEKVRAGELELKAIWSPGHTPACMVYVVGDAVFTGDTIFMPDFGTARCDFPGGSAELLYESIQKIYALNEEFRVFVGHDYGTDQRKFAWETSVHAEKYHNKQLNVKIKKEEFLKWRKERDAKLALPKLIFQSLQVNLRNGVLPEKETNGVSYFKIPINLN
jgi:glyoxylase-like metal-dependent hydrolase (beta-lactamase superfamily II)